MTRGRVVRSWWVLGVLSLASCSGPVSIPFPSTSELAHPRGLKIARTIVHAHSPYSYDACDKKGLIDGQPNLECLGHLREALCQNSIDAIFLSDHPEEMDRYSIEELLLKKEGDNLIVNGSSLPYANSMSGCEKGYRPLIFAGFESKFLALGMTQHLSADQAVRRQKYNEESLSVRNELATTSEAIVLIPHTESRSDSVLQAVQPDGIEIYNVHANLDPKIRKTSLGVPPFQPVSKLLMYATDPYDKLDPDYSFLHFLEVFPVYASKWNAVLAAGLKVAGWGGSDNHENTLPQKASDGERIDSHRRMTRLVTNHLLLSSIDPPSVKSSLKSGRGYVVFEGLGTPNGFDFRGVQAATTIEMGGTISMAGGAATIEFKMPELYLGSSKIKDSPVFEVRLKRVTSSGTEETLLVNSGANFSFSLPTVAAASTSYRVEIDIVPLHLYGVLRTYRELARKTFPWLRSNPIYVQP